MEHISLWELLREPEGGGFTWDPEGCVKESSQNGPLQRGPVGKPGGGAHLPGASRDRGGPLLGTLKDMLSKALETGVFFHRGPNVGNMQAILLS